MDIVLAFSALCILLVVGKILRVTIRLFQKLYLPASVIGGLLGLALVQTIGGFLPEATTAGWTRLPGFLINIVFSALFLGVFIPPIRRIWGIAGPQLAYGQIVAWGQYVVGLGGRCCTALAESEIRLWWWPRYVSSMKYPKRCQYKHAKQKKYHVRNWAEYNEGLRRRGDLTVWFDEEAIANWKADKTGKPGGQRVYSDMAIETGLVVRMVYKLAYRQTEGFLHSIASLLGLGIEIPDYSTLCRRSRLLRKKLRIPKAASTQPIHLMIDSTGLRIHVGNARKPPKQRAWRKLHIAVDRETGNIVASELTASRARDATRVPALLTQIQAPLVSVAADSAYDKEAVYEAIEAHSPGRRTRVVIPPQRNATLSQNSNAAMQERDRHIRAIERHGRREWYKLSGYTKRSMVENAVYRYKAIIGPEMRARTLARQRVEHRIGCEILNKMAALGMPDTYCAG